MSLNNPSCTRDRPCAFCAGVAAYENKDGLVNNPYPYSYDIESDYKQWIFGWISEDSNQEEEPVIPYGKRKEILAAAFGAVLDVRYGDRDDLAIAQIEELESEIDAMVTAVEPLILEAAQQQQQTTTATSVKTALAKLDGSTRTAVALLLGVSVEELDAFGGVKEEDEDRPTPKLGKLMRPELSDLEGRLREAEQEAERQRIQASELDSLIGEFVDRWENL